MARGVPLVVVCGMARGVLGCCGFLAEAGDGLPIAEEEDAAAILLLARRLAATLPVPLTTLQLSSFLLLLEEELLRAINESNEL